MTKTNQGLMSLLLDMKIPKIDGRIDDLTRPYTGGEGWGRPISLPDDPGYEAFDLGHYYEAFDLGHMVDYWIDPVAISRAVTAGIGDRIYSDLEKQNEAGKYYMHNSKDIARAVRGWYKNKAAQALRAARFPFLVGDLVSHPLAGGAYATIQEIEVCGPLYSNDGLGDLRFAVCLAFFANEKGYKKGEVLLSFHVMGPDHWWLLSPVHYRPEPPNEAANG